MARASLRADLQRYHASALVVRHSLLRAVLFVCEGEMMRSLLNWRGHGSKHEGAYWVTWERNVERESMLYRVFSRVTRREILVLEVF
jgi:hypothetical protein